MKAYRFKDLKSKNPNVECDSFAIRRVNGQDEDTALGIAKAKGQTEKYAEELIRLSVVEFDGQKVSQPWTAFDQLEAPTRTALMVAFKKVNSLEDFGFLENPEPMAE